MRVGVELRGFKELAARFATYDEKGKGDVLMPVAVAMANVHTTHAKAHAPVDTGTLMRSIHVEPKTSSGARATATSGTDVDYGIYQEFGTRFQSGHAFMRPAMDEIHEEARDEARGVWADVMGF
jgi:HK97 gp10 family phage protein